MRKVLVVDDEQSITDGLVALFDDEDIDAGGAYDAAVATAMVASEFFPVVLADLRIGSEEDGLKLIEQVRRISPRSRIATLTAFATPELEEELLRLGSSIVLRKPMDFEAVVAVVQEMLEAIEAEAVARESAGEQPLDLAQLHTDMRRILYSIPQRRYGFSADEAEELIQEAWLLFLEKRQNIQLLKPWLAGTVANLCKQRIYKHQRNRETTRPLTDHDAEVFTAKRMPEIDRLMLHEAFSRVDDRTRALCTLIAIEGWSYDEVAIELGIPLGSVGPLYIRAKDKLRKAMTTVN